MKTIDLNADLGEAETASGSRAEGDVLRYISSANIACGAHAGSPEIMRKTVRRAMKNNVVIGAHPSYPDRGNFGRKSMRLGEDIDADTLRQSLMSQIVSLTEIAAEEGASVSYMKPHGALYNDAAENTELAQLIVDCLAELDSRLAFMGSPGSALETAAKAKNLWFIREGFIDRKYLPNGRLQPRSIDGAVIKDQKARLSQTLSLTRSQSVTAADGAVIAVPVDTLCLHGDSEGAVETARQARAAIEAAGVQIKAFAHAH